MKKTTLIITITMIALNLLSVNLPAYVNIPDSQYVQATRDGRLELDGEEVRFWGFIGHVVGRGARIKDSDSPEQRKQKVAQARAEIDGMVKRIGDLGFNLLRIQEFGGDRVTPPLVFDHDYEIGDGSAADLIAYYLNELDKAGIKVWMSSINKLGVIKPDDVDIIDDPATARQWKQGLTELINSDNSSKKKGALDMRRAGRWLLRSLDPRFEALQIKRYGMVADFPNKYKDVLRLGDDPQIVVWEITNEHFPYRHFFNGDWTDLPSYFRNNMIAKWNNFLKRKYKTDSELTKAWGFLLDGESLEQGTVMLVPLAKPQKGDVVLNDANPAIIESLKGRDQEYSREDFTWQRGADVIAFSNELLIGHKERVEEAIHKMGKSCRLSPTLHDSGNSFRIQSTYMHQFADAVSTCSYWKGMGHDPSHKRYPFFSALDESPRTCWGVPWLEQSTGLNIPHFVYETNLDCRTKYRVEYPLRVAALASIQDWSIICWHIYGRPHDFTKDDPFEGRKLHIGHDYLEYGNDEVLLGSMRSAAEIFKNKLIKPAPKPTVYTFGSKSLYDPVSMDYGKSYGDYREQFIGTTYRYGTRLHVDPTMEKNKLEGPSVRPNVYESCPLTPHEQIVFDWHNGYLKMQSPAAAAYSGFLADYGSDTITFDNGVTLTDIEINNPDGISYPVTEDEKYIAVTLASTDGKPLSKTEKAVLTALSTSFNKGYELDLTRSAKGMYQHGPMDVPPREFWGAWVGEQGKEPVQVARVGVTVKADAIDGMTYTLRDWGMNRIGGGTVQNGTLRIDSDKPVWVVELER